jgi:hypothetical protein
VGLRAVLDAVVKRKIPSPRRESNPRTPIVLPLVIRATGGVTKGLKEYLETIPGKRSVESLQTTAVRGTSHITRKVLQCET